MRRKEIAHVRAGDDLSLPHIALIARGKYNHVLEKRPTKVAGEFCSNNQHFCDDGPT